MRVSEKMSLNNSVANKERNFCKIYISAGLLLRKVCSYAELVIGDKQSRVTRNIYFFRKPSLSTVDLDSRKDERKREIAIHFPVSPGRFDRVDYDDYDFPLPVAVIQSRDQRPGRGRRPWPP